jgi:hypothetical protein
MPIPKTGFAKKADMATLKNARRLPKEPPAQ